MPPFIVRFFKDVIGDEGQVCEACQHAIEVDARNEAEAARIAKQKFCELHSTLDWSLHADRVDVKPADFPS